MIKSKVNNALCIFAKYPELGKVKTRLAKDVGETKALQIYAKVLNNLIKEHKNNDYDLHIAFTPTSKEKEFKQLYSNLKFFSQNGENLGVKIHNAFRHLLKKYKKVIIIGSDTPDLSKELINKAFNELNEKEIVLGPCFDGGYYLIGMKKNHDVFSNIKWSTDSVLNDTINIIERKRLSLVLLSKKHDIDTKDELKYYDELI